MYMMLLSEKNIFYLDGLWFNFVRKNKIIPKDKPFLVKEECLKIADDNKNLSGVKMKEMFDFLGNCEKGVSVIFKDSL